ncbi:MAG: hypothetical protein ACXQTC_00360 [Methanopyraceae archaeon]
MLAPLIAFLLLTAPAAGVRVEEYDWTVTAVKLETGQGEMKVPLMHPTRLRFMVASPDYGQAEFGRDVDGDGVPDHTWCGEVAALTLYNIAVAKGFWRPTAGTDVNPLNLELRESWFARMTGIPVEDRETDGPMAATSPPWFPTLLSLAADFQDPNGIGVVIYAPLATVSRWFVIVPPALHAVLLAGVSDDGRYFVVKDCSALQGRDYSWEKDYYLVPSYSLELNVAEAVEAVSNPLQESSGAMVPVLFFPVPRFGLPEDLKPFAVGGKEVDLGGGLKARFHILLASTISDVLEIARILLRHGIPVECLVRKPFASLAFTGQIVEIPLVHLRVLRILSVPVRCVVTGTGGGSGASRPAPSSRSTPTEEARKDGKPARRHLPVPPMVPLWGGFGCRRLRRSG